MSTPASCFEVQRPGASCKAGSWSQIRSSVAENAPLLAVVLWLFEATGSWAWLIGWGVVTVFQVFLLFVGPTWIMPLFNKFVPLEEGALKSAIETLARAQGFHMKGIFTMDGSRRSSKGNAFFTGFGKTRRIVLFDTLVENHSPAELVAVLAHEMGHYKKKHILLSLAAGILQTGLMFYLLSLLIDTPALYEAFAISTPSVYTGLVFFALLYSPAEFISGILVRLLSRRNEYQADRFAVETTGDTRPMIDALKKLSVQNLTNLLPHRLTVLLNYSHPPVLQRINDLTRTG